MHAPSEHSGYVAALVDAHRDIAEVWLIGSRANGTAHAGSDWDFLVFGPTGLVERLKTDTTLHREDVDLLVVDPDSGEFEKPWGATRKRGNLETWNWFRLNDTEAEYHSARWIPDPDPRWRDKGGGDWADENLKAVRVWPLA